MAFLGNMRNSGYTEDPVVWHICWGGVVFTLGSLSLHFLA
jgi:hypothetical protein